MLIKYTHDEMVDIARHWLERQCTVVITEMASGGGEIPDAIGWAHGESILIECKVSIADFQRDREKDSRKLFGLGVYRWYLMPMSMLNETELPGGWGLLEWNGKKVKAVRKAEKRCQYTANNELFLLLSALRRIGKFATEGISVKPYIYVTKNRARLGVASDENRRNKRK